MRPLSTPELLAIWEQGAVQSAVPWAMALLAAACPENTPEKLARWPIGERDGRLLTLYEWTFGPTLVGLAGCPACREKLELTFQVADIRARPDETAQRPPGVLQMEGYEVHFRLPNSWDVTAVDNPTALFQRCITQVNRHGQEQPVETLPENVVTAVIAHMARTDPQADVQLALTCPTCQHPWQATFDIITFFWQALNTWAYRLLYEVHLLASAYGWREVDILALSPWRRHFYLELVSHRR